ncbi:penicillin-binding protein [Candidatus Saccharibacteria bacterium]|nr:MAG: penicillin-binding protein [Candidatus Saccharibacteria bacterium]
MGFRKFVAVATLGSVLAGYAGYKGLIEPNQIPEDFGISSVDFPIPQKLGQTGIAGGETGLICAADTNPCTKANALGVMATATTTVKTAYQDISNKFVSSLIAVEDKNFLANDGCDIQAILRAARDFGLSGGSRVQGASGITRQLVSKIDASPRPQDKKTLDAIGAEGVECLQARYVEKELQAKLGSKQAAKDVVIEAFSNIISYGRDAYGIEAASRQYFGKSANNLSLPESLLLVGVINEPSNFDVNFTADSITPERSRIYADFSASIASQLSSDNSTSQRRNITYRALATAVADGTMKQDVADQIKTYAGYVYESQRLRYRYETVVNIAADNNPNLISPDMRDSLLRAENFPLIIPYKPVVPMGISFKGAENINAQHFTDFVINNSAELLSEKLGRPVNTQEVMSGRYTIQTSLITADQVAMNNAIQSYPRTKSINGAGVSLDEKGNIVAMVGSKNYGQVQTNIAVGKLGGGGGRDTGSGNKHIAYAVSLENGVDPNAQITVPNSVTIEQPGQQPWVVTGHTGCSALKLPTPCNMTPSQALATSSNTWAAATVNKYGIRQIVDKMNAFGMVVPEPYVPSIILGATAMSPLQEAVGMRGILSNEGTALFYGKTAWSAIKKITDNTADGKTVYEQPAPTKKVVFSTAIALATTQALKTAVNQPYGTAYGQINSPSGPESVAGKTGTAGTTAGEKDIWFSGGVRDADKTLTRYFSFWGGHADAERSIGTTLAGADMAAVAGRYITGRPHTTTPADIAAK